MKQSVRVVTQLVVIGLLIFAATQQANAVPNVVYTGLEEVYGTGFGNLHNLLVLQKNGSETGYVQPTNDNEGDATNQSRTYSFDTLINFLGINSGSELLLGLNTNETGEDPTLNLLTFYLDVYDADGNIVASTTGLDLTANSGSNIFDASTQQGQGKAADVFVLNDDAIALLAPYFAAPDDYFLGARGSFSGSDDGPDGWYIISDTAPVPEPGTIMLLGVGFFGLAVYGRRRKNTC